MRRGGAKIFIPDEVGKSEYSRLMDLLSLEEGERPEYFALHLDVAMKKWQQAINESGSSFAGKKTIDADGLSLIDRLLIGNLSSEELASYDALLQASLLFVFMTIKMAREDPSKVPSKSVVVECINLFLALPLSSEDMSGEVLGKLNEAFSHFEWYSQYNNERE